MDRPKLDQMLSNLRRYAEVLKRLAETPRDAFLANPDQAGNARYHLVIAIECCIDLRDSLGDLGAFARAIAARES